MDDASYDRQNLENFQYEPYITKGIMNGEIVSVAGGLQKDTRQKITCCFCFKTTKLRRRQYVVSFFTNLGIFSLLLGYTFLGSFIFLAIEGGGYSQAMRPRMLPDKQLSNKVSDRTYNVNGSDYEEPTKESKHFKLFEPSERYQNFSDVREKTVESMWEITVSLNVLYRENWTRLASQEISKFQDELVQRVTQEMAAQYGAVYQEMALGGVANTFGEYSLSPEEGEWTLAKAFFYSLTVLTTIGYGSLAPRTALGKAVTIGYALFGIPLTMLYLTSVGSMLSKVARGAFSRALCCCLCSNCGYCCYDERRMAEKERRMKMKRQQEEIRQQQQQQQQQQGSQKPQEPFYVVKAASDAQNKDVNKSNPNLNKDMDNISWPDTDSKLSMQGLSILAPILLCLCIMFIYIVIGTIVLYKIDNLRPIDGFYFCFMSLSTIGFGNLIPGHSKQNGSETTTLWFCSIYILSGLALTAMCFNVVHDEIVHRLKHQQKEWSQKGNAIKDEVNLRDPFYIAS